MSGFETIEAGGASARLYVAGDVRPGAAGVVLLHAWWGLNDDIVAYADRLAAAGLAVVAPDMFDGQVASVDDLADRLGPTAELGVVGFSFGAAYASLIPAERDCLVASVVYYGTYTGSHLARSSGAVLGHFAETDPFETDEGIAEFEDAIRSAGRDVVIHRYPGTGHWFAEPSRDAYRAEAADLAFDRTVTFLRTHLEPGPPSG
jgi:carboxymethylenebutenolidase